MYDAYKNGRLLLMTH